ncbi:hypothetical protein ACKKBG_A17805 [Auxenochlorella protothecoides x Auxenochlorella symbiontica]|uniref:RING-type domain-containing protein n=1 Tax=Auxenochlorella protothecoides TaxID=3075 RepID=A0A1D2A8A0_AUXPR
MRGCTFLVVLLVLGVHAGAEWTPSTFPNPKVDIGKCGRRVASNICDPDGVLAQAEADRVEGVIKDIWAGVDPYIRKKCGDEMEGYMVGVALMRSMHVDPGQEPGAAAEAFAHAVHAAWGVGSAACNNGVLLLLALDQRQVYISTGAGATKALPDAHLAAIIAAARPLLRRQLTGEAVQQMVVDVGLGLAGSPGPRHDSEDGLDWVGVGIFGTVAAVIGGSMWKHWRRKKEFKACKRMLDKIKREQDNLRTHAWSRPASCPVCLEDFSAPPGPGEGAEGTVPSSTADEARASSSSAPSAPLLPGGDAGVGLRRRSGGQEGAKEGSGDGDAKTPVTLRCGHTFCEPCLEQWLDNHTNCPICRQDVSTPPGAPTGKGQPATQQQTSTAEERERAQRAAQEVLNTDLSFRLLMLQRMYPWYLTDDMIGRWTGEARETGTFDWAGTREFQLRDPGVAAQQRESGASGFGGGWGGGHSVGGGGAGGSW